MLPERIQDASILAGYLTDASNQTGHADALLRPKNTAEVSLIVAHCQANGIPLTVTSARTSTTGGPVPYGGWLMSMEHLNQIEHIGEDTATAGAGVFLGEFQNEIEAKGRFFPPDPTSRFECSLGGAIACNASGARSFRYGPSRPWIEAIEVVLPTGEVLSVDGDTPIPADWPVPEWTEPAVKTAAGYVPSKRLIDLFIGQEGTLGILTKATVRLTALPTEVMGILAFFPSRASAVTFVERARTAVRNDRNGALSPRCLEYLDHNCLVIARERVAEVPDGAQAALFCEQEFYVDEEAHLEAWWQALEETGALADDTIVATDPSSQAELHALRHAVPAGINEQVVANGMRKVGTDLAVPDAALDQMMTAYEAAPIAHALFGHIGDNHLHLNFLPSTQDELATAKSYYDELAALAVSLGGTVSAEHGIGKLKRKHLVTMVGPEVIESFRALKRHLDPAWILGRDNILVA